MLSNPFRRRAKRNGPPAPTPLDFSQDDDLDIDPLEPGAPELAKADPAPDRDAAIEDAKAARKRDAAQLAGGEKRLGEIAGFAETNFLPEPAKAELRKQKRAFDDAIDAGPLDQAVRPLREMEKRAREAKGAALTAPTQPDPRETAHLPYLDASQLVADMSRPEYRGNAAAKTGAPKPSTPAPDLRQADLHHAAPSLAGAALAKAPDAAATRALHQAIQSKLRKSDLFGQTPQERIEPEAPKPESKGEPRPEADARFERVAAETEARTATEGLAGLIRRDIDRAADGVDGAQALSDAERAARADDKRPNNREAAAGVQLADASAGPADAGDLPLAPRPAERPSVVAPLDKVLRRAGKAASGVGLALTAAELIGGEAGTTDYTVSGDGAPGDQRDLFVRVYDTPFGRSAAVYRGTPEFREKLATLIEGEREGGFVVPFSTHREPVFELSAEGAVLHAPEVFAGLRQQAGVDDLTTLLQEARRQAAAEPFRLPGFAEGAAPPDWRDHVEVFPADAETIRAFSQLPGFAEGLAPIDWRGLIEGFPDDSSEIAGEIRKQWTEGGFAPDPEAFRGPFVVAMKAPPGGLNAANAAQYLEEARKWQRGMEPLNGRITSPGDGLKTAGVVEIGDRLFLGVDGSALQTTDANTGPGRYWRDFVLEYGNGEARALFHAEANLLLRAYLRNRETLPEEVRIYMDRDLCRFCRDYLPGLMHALGVTTLHVENVAGDTETLHAVSVEEIWKRAYEKNAQR